MATRGFFSQILTMLMSGVAAVGFAHAANAADAHAIPSSPVSVVTPDGQIVCGGDAFTQIPGRPDLFIGRIDRIGSLDECHTPSEKPVIPTLAMYRMDWRSDQMVLQQKILSVPIRGRDGAVVAGTAYDPYAFTYHGRLWVGFECSKPGIDMCVAPLTADFLVDTGRLTKPIIGRGLDRLDDRSGTATSASVPKFLVYQDRIYAYWIAGLARNLDHKMINLSSRGMELAPDGFGRMWGSASGGRSVYSDDTRLTTSVFDINPANPLQSRIAELEDVRFITGNIVAITAIGGSYCSNANSVGSGCDRAVVSIASKPLAPNVFGSSVARFQPLPVNPQQYSRFVTDGQGRLFILARFSPPGINKGIVIDKGLRLFPAPDLRN